VDASGCRPAALSRKRSDFITEPRAATFPRLSYWSVAVAPATSGLMGEHVAQQNIERDQTNRKRPSKQTAAAIGHKLLEIIVYRKTCRIGGKLSVNDLVETSEIGDWKMPDFKMACTYAASQGWLIVADDGLTLTTAGLAAA
jgi:hypothetical protein